MATRWSALRQQIGKLVFTSFLLAVIGGFQAHAITQIPNPDPQPGSYGLEATKTQPPPKIGATISSPSNGQVFSTSPITVEGICPTGLLVELHDNGVMVGSVMCTNGTFSLQISLFVGQNELSAVVYDDTDQAGPASNTVTVTYNNTNFSAFGELVTLTSIYSRRAESINRELTWPLQLSGGTGPYALTIDWGDGSTVDLKSLATTGTFNINHVYKRAGIYTINVKAVDKNGVSAFLQLVAVANGQASADTSSTSKSSLAAACGNIIVIWIPVVIIALMLPVAYWLGRRSELVSLRTKLEKDRDAYEKEAEKS